MFRKYACLCAPNWWNSSDRREHFCTYHAGNNSWKLRKLSLANLFDVSTGTWAKLKILWSGWENKANWNPGVFKNKMHWSLSTLFWSSDVFLEVIVEILSTTNNSKLSDALLERTEVSLFFHFAFEPPEMSRYYLVPSRHFPIWR